MARPKLQCAAIALTQRCNLACSHCADTASGNRTGTRHEISRPLLRSLFTQFHTLGVEQVILSGGEPLLRKDLFEIIDDAGEAGLSCALLTNGTLLTRAMLKRLKATGVVDYLRLSVEFPEGTSGETVRCHNAGETFRMVSAAAEAGLSVGINMTLMPGNVRYIGELAAASRTAGAEFFRAVPVLPSGRGESLLLPGSFQAQCIAAMLRLHAKYRADFPAQRSRDRQSSPSWITPFITACSGGGRSLSITADGRAHICSMAELGGRPVNVCDTSVVECVRRLSRRRAYLQKKVVESSGSTCRNCGFVAECRGGCLSEWTVRGKPAGQPCCVAENWKSAMSGGRLTKQCLNAAAEIRREYSEYQLFNLPVPCVRALPVWVVYF